MPVGTLGGVRGPGHAANPRPPDDPRSGHDHLTHRRRAPGSAPVTDTSGGPDPRDERLFPLLTDDQRAAVAASAETREFAVGDVLFEQGVTDAPFIVLTAGRVEFFDRQPDGDRFINTLLPGTFIGDVAIFTGEPTIAACVAAEPSEALVMSRDDLRRLTADRPDVADLVLSTMSTRREWLEGRGYGQARVFGNRWSAEAFAVRDLLGRNQVPHRWVDVDADAEDAALLSSLGVRAEDLPVVVDSTAVLHRPDVPISRGAPPCRPGGSARCCRAATRSRRCAGRTA